MSTLKSDAVTAVTADTALSLSGAGTAGVKISDYLVQTKGADIASGTTLTLGKDGNQFDVTGTTTITGIATQGIGSYVTLHFDGVLTFTHHSTNLILPGAANITTAAGDIAVMYEYASADWRCVSYTKASGLSVVAAGGAWNFLSTAVASDDATLGITWTNSTDYDTIVIAVTDLHPADDNVELNLRLGDSSGIDSGASDYSWWNWAGLADSTSGAIISDEDDADSVMSLMSSGNGMGNAAGEGGGAMIYISTPHDGINFPMIHGTTTATDYQANTYAFGGGFCGNRKAVITVDRAEVLCESGNVISGRIAAWGIAHV